MERLPRHSGAGDRHDFDQTFFSGGHEAFKVAGVRGPKRLLPSPLRMLRSETLHIAQGEGDLEVPIAQSRARRRCRKRRCARSGRRNQPCPPWSPWLRNRRTPFWPCRHSRTAAVRTGQRRRSNPQAGRRARLLLQRNHRSKVSCRHFQIWSPLSDPRRRHWVSTPIKLLGNFAL